MDTEANTHTLLCSSDSGHYTTYVRYGQAFQAFWSFNRGLLATFISLVFAFIGLGTVAYLLSDFHDARHELASILSSWDPAADAALRHPPEDYTFAIESLSGPINSQTVPMYLYTHDYALQGRPISVNGVPPTCPDVHVLPVARAVRPVHEWPPCRAIMPYIDYTTQRIDISAALPLSGVYSAKLTRGGSGGGNGGTTVGTGTIAYLDAAQMNMTTSQCPKEWFSPFTRVCVSASPAGALFRLPADGQRHTVQQYTLDIDYSQVEFTWTSDMAPVLAMDERSPYVWLLAHAATLPVGPPVVEIAVVVVAACCLLLLIPMLPLVKMVRHNRLIRDETSEE